MEILYFQRYNMYLSLAVHLTGFSAAVVTGKHLYGYRLFPIINIKCLLVTLTCTALLTNGVSIVGSILMLNFGQSLSTCTLITYNISVAPLTSTVVLACLAIDRFYMTKKKVPNVRKIQFWNMVTIVSTALLGHTPIILSVLEKPIPLVAKCAGFDYDQPDKWYGLLVASIIFVLCVITACYTFKLKRIFKNSLKNRYSRKIPDNVMKIVYGYSICPVLFVAAVVSFPGHKVLINNLVDFIYIFLLPLLLRYAVKDQKSTPRTRQLHENNIEVLTQKSVINGDISWSAGVVKSQNNLSETVTIVNKSTASTVKYSKRSEPKNKKSNESNPDEIITESVENNCFSGEDHLGRQ